MSTDYIPDHDAQLVSIYERDMARQAPEDPDEEADDPCEPEGFEED